MANEIIISSTTGLTPSIQLYIGVIPIGVPFTATEIGLTGEYVASMPSNIPFGKYLIIVMASPFIKIGSGEIFWDGAYEVEQSLGMLEGLDKNNPMIVTDNSRTVGSISLGISETTTTTTVTRQ